MSDWKMEMHKMLAAINRQIDQSLRVIKAIMEMTDQQIDPEFKKYFLATVNQRIEETFDQFETISSWENECENNKNIKSKQLSCASGIQLNNSANDLALCSTLKTEPVENSDEMSLNLEADSNTSHDGNIADNSIISSHSNQTETENSSIACIGAVKAEPLECSSEVDEVIRLDSDSDNGMKEFIVRQKNKVSSKTRTPKRSGAKGNKRLKCSHCEYSTDWTSDLIRHLRTHSGEKPFQCDECKKTFSQKSSLDRHKLVHSSEKPFQCDRCARRFTRITYLKDHMKEHSKDFRYICSRCFDGFSSKKQKIEHENKCKWRKYECFICKEYTTVRIGNLKSHMLKHSNKKLWRCEICLKQYSHKRSLGRHLNKTHGKKR